MIVMTLDLKQIELHGIGKLIQRQCKLWIARVVKTCALIFNRWLKEKASLLRERRLLLQCFQDFMPSLWGKTLNCSCRHNYWTKLHCISFTWYLLGSKRSGSLSDSSTMTRHLRGFRIETGFLSLVGRSIHCITPCLLQPLLLYRASGVFLVDRDKQFARVILQAFIGSLDSRF